MKKISIVTPMYNSFQQMKRNLKILEKFPPEGMELIIVDDCSKDDSYEQALSYSENAAFPIRVLKNQTNSGPGISRNVGVENADGDYITFVDSDDYLSEDFYEQMYPLMEQSIDCVIFDYQFVSNSGEKLGEGSSIGSSLLLPGLLERNSAFVYTFGSTCGKLYKREILTQYNIQFGKFYRSEDMPFTKVALARCGSIYYFPKRLYNYVQLESSLMHNAALNDERNCQRAFRMVLEQLGDTGMDKELMAVELREVLNNSIQTMIGRGCTNREIVDYIREHYKIEHLKNPYIKGYPAYVRVIGWLAYFHCIFPIRIIGKIKEWIKERRFTGLSNI